MDYVLARQIICAGDLCAAGRFGETLFFHQLRTFQPQLHSGVCVNRIVYAAVTRVIAAGEAAVGGVYDGSGLERRYISMPKIEIIMHWSQIADVRYAFFLDFTLQQQRPAVL